MAGPGTPERNRNVSWPSQRKPMDGGWEAIGPLDRQAMEQARAHLDRLVKPPGSLGRLEELAVHLAGIFAQAPPPYPVGKALLVFAGDHGVVQHGVSAYPQWVTARMVEVFLQEGSAIGVLARRAGAQLWVVDVGVRHAPPPQAAARPSSGSPPVGLPNEGPRWVFARVCDGTRDFTQEPAMTRRQAEQAMAVGARVVREAVAAGARLVGLGEMGIGNTTSASALVAALTGASPQEVVGPGTGLDEAGLARKREVVARALQRHRPDPSDPLGTLAAVGGLEIAALVGALLEAARLRVAAVLDGFVVGAAALVAAAMAPQATAYWIASHLSAEPGHRLVLERLGLRPLLQLEMRLGEASGAALAFDLLEAALALCRNMWTLAQAGVCPP